MRSTQSGVGWDLAFFLCASDCGKGEKKTHRFHAEHGEYNEVYEIKCEDCGACQKVKRHDWLSQLTRDHIRPTKANLTKYPYIEPHSGELVHSAEHRKEVWKRMGLHEAKHGIDDRYSENQECENLKNNRLAFEKRMREREERYRHRGMAAPKRR